MLKKCGVLFIPWVRFIDDGSLQLVDMDSSKLKMAILKATLTLTTKGLSWFSFVGQRLFSAIVCDAFVVKNNMRGFCVSIYSQVVVDQKALLYQSSHDWWCYKTVHEELFDNHENFPARWQYEEKVTSEAKATWTLIKALKSSKVLPMRLTLEYPVAKYGHEPMSVEFDCTRLSPENKAQHASSGGQFNISQNVTVQPYSSSKVCGFIRPRMILHFRFLTQLNSFEPSFLLLFANVIGADRGLAST